MDGVGRFALEALASGASGILGPEAGVGDLLKAIRVVQSGQIWATGNVIRRSVEAFAALRETSRLNEAALAHLSAREAEVARLVSVGLANKEVAAQLAISTGTVKAHLTQVFQKLGLRSRSELVACLRGLVGRPTTKVEASPSSQDQLTGVCPVCHAKAV
jgi:DNA-binding NarL/FixJ family response regulator